MPQKQRQKLWTQILDQVEKDLELVKTLIRVLSVWISVASIFVLECVNMRLEHALYGTDRSYIEFIDVLSLNWHQYRRQVLLVNARVEGKLLQIVVDKVKCRPECGKIPVVAGAGTKRFLC
jgi:hypothetical protein